MPRFCHNCGRALVEPSAFCPACGTAVDSSLATTETGNHSAGVSAAFESDGRMRFRLGLAAAFGVLLVGIVVALASRSSPPDETEAPTSTISKNEAKPSPAPSEDSTSAQHEATPAVVLPDRSEDHELREDGRVYSVALIVATPEIPVGAKLFAQGRVATFDYASGMRSRPFAVIADEQQPSKTLLCGMMGEEGMEVVSLYHVGEIVAVSGEYMATSSVSGYPAMPIVRDCHVAGPQSDVVRLAPPTSGEPRSADGSQTAISTITAPQQPKTITVTGSSCDYDVGLCTADAGQKSASAVTILWLACRVEWATCKRLAPGAYTFDLVNSGTAPECSPIMYPGVAQKAFCVQLHSRPYDLIYSMQSLKETSAVASKPLSITVESINCSFDEYRSPVSCKAHAHTIHKDGSEEKWLLVCGPPYSADFPLCLATLTAGTYTFDIREDVTLLCRPSHDKACIEIHASPSCVIWAAIRNE